MIDAACRLPEHAHLGHFYRCSNCGQWWQVVVASDREFNIIWRPVGKFEMFFSHHRQYRHWKSTRKAGRK
jgi:hypothetical protein